MLVESVRENISIASDDDGTDSVTSLAAIVSPHAIESTVPTQFELYGVLEL